MKQFWKCELLKHKNDFHQQVETDWGMRAENCSNLSSWKVGLGILLETEEICQKICFLGFLDGFTFKWYTDA